MLGDLTANYNGIPRSYYRFGASWPHVRETLLVIQEQDSDPFAVMMPTTEIIRFYYALVNRMIASNPVQSTTTKRRFRQRMILPGANSPDSLLLMFRLLKK